MKRLGVTLLLAAAVLGCSKGKTYVPVTGTVKYADGTVPKGQAGSVTFQPAAGGVGSKGASSRVAEDGSFSLSSIQPGDGAKPGEYNVTLSILDSYPKGKSVVAEKYTKAGTTPLKATVKDSGTNHFDFVLDKQ